ncbi:3-isopropylmalate dehydratase large subunit [Striga asiatica]|uniref:3-isopropylmalate dehydratase large subunit n=1 Tax=Striga asiatica TaxID=4170 RepID=A0A5A7QWM5_STRAF|nr:3-isopropylmalate dehydratase large subunit [Striga asiatica]
MTLMVPLSAEIRVLPQQVYYTRFPTASKHTQDAWVVFKTKARQLIDVRGVISENKDFNMVDNLSFQEESPINNIPLVPISQELDNEEIVQVGESKYVFWGTMPRLSSAFTKSIPTNSDGKKQFDKVATKNPLYLKGLMMSWTARYQNKDCTCVDEQEEEALEVTVEEFE